MHEQIKNAKAGKQSAFRFLLNTFWGYVYTYQLNKLQNENDAEDITIQTFSKAFDKIATFNEDYVFKTWLIAISKNVHIDFLRKKSSAIQTENTPQQEQYLQSVADDSPSPEDTLITEQNLAKLLQDIKKLKPKYQDVIQLRYFQELSYSEIAQQLNEPISNVKVKLLRAKKMLAEIIKKA